MHRMPGLPSALAACLHRKTSAPGIGDPEARLRVALRTSSVATSCRNLTLDCHYAAPYPPSHNLLGGFAAEPRSGV